MTVRLINHVLVESLGVCAGENHLDALDRLIQHQIRCHKKQGLKIPELRIPELKIPIMI